MAPDPVYEEGVVLCVSEKGKDLVGFRGYLYRVHEKPGPKDTKIRWVCNSTNRCIGKLWTTMDKTGAFENGVHSAGCTRNPERVEVAKVVSDMKTAARTATQPMPQLYRTFKQQLAAKPLGNIIRLSQLQNWAMDGMFSQVPALYMQFWTIHAFWDKKLLPMVYVLTTRKTQELYISIIRLLKDRAAELGLVLNPPTIHCDFETGLLPALRMEFPATRICGCHFHFCQCIYRKVQHVGLIEWYNDREDDQGRLNIRMLMASAFLPVNRVQPWFDQFRDQMAYPVRVRLRPILDYFNNFWLNTIDLELWNMFKVLRRTNNNLEGWHSGFEKRLGNHPNPSFLKFLDAILSEHAIVEASIPQLEAGATLVRSNKIYTHINKRITTLTQRYDDTRNDNNFEAENSLVLGVAHNLSEPCKLSL